MSYVKSGEINIYYEERGTGFPLILLMGLGSDHTDWNKHSVDFEKYFRCILIDNRGVGKSDKPEGLYTSKEMAADTLAVMDYLGIEKAYVNGCSMGGTIAQELVFMATDRISKIVLTSSFSYRDTYSKCIGDTLIAANTYLPKANAKILTSLLFFSRSYFNENIEEILRAEGTKAEGSSLPPYAYRAQFNAVATFNSRDRISKINIPCLIYNGDHDAIVSLEQIKWMAETIPKSKLIISKGKGHTFHFEEPEIYNKNVIEFLNKN